MNIDPQEINQVAIVAPRVDMYSGIHKAMRACMADALLAVGRMDVEDDLELAQVTERVMALLDACISHLRHENDFVHKAIEARAPGGSDQIAREHEEHQAGVQRLAAAVAALRACPQPLLRFGLAQSLYRELSLFIAHNFEHMHVEETAHNAVLWARYTDAELVAIHDELLASVPPEEFFGFARWLVPFLSPQERAGMLADLRSKVPAPVFQAVIDTAQPHLTQNEWAKLARALELPVAPGLVTA